MLLLMLFVYTDVIQVQYLKQRSLMVATDVAHSYCDNIVDQA